MRTELLRALVEASGPPGREDRVAAVVRPELEAVCDRVDEEPLGGLIGVRAGNGGPRLMLAAHMDEIALMVTHVEERGYLRVIPLGGWDPRTLVGQRVVVHGRRDLLGVVGTRPVHLLDAEERKRVPQIADLAIDVGLGGEAALEAVRPGDTATRVRTLEEMGQLLTAKSLDDRVGVFVMLEALRAAGPSGAEVHAAATVQEEVGLRGARVAAGRVRPQIALALDICPADDGPGTPTDAPGTRLGRGAALRVADASAIGSTPLIDLLVSVAEERGIPWQVHVSDRGGTDAGAMQVAGDGALAACVSVPTRYVHSSVEACHPDDIEAAVALVAGFVERAGELSAALAPG
jgi:tetrahedral aminopeptidase